ncbi:MAG: VWA domain-containing protein [Acidobacteriia bacterium]|nr:VWA domain-containing protein [Terriglobia bacterium]
MARFRRIGPGSIRSLRTQTHPVPAILPNACSSLSASVLRPWISAALMALFIAAALVFCAAPLARAQSTTGDVHVTPRKEPDKNKAFDVDPRFKTHTKPVIVDVDLVLVNVTITDPMNRLVTGLEKENFKIFEGNQEQQIRHFSNEDAPISLGVIFDVSGSMKTKIEKAREAVVEFFRTANPQDEFFLVTFSDRPQLLADFTQSIEDIQSKVVFTMPQGLTALLDAIYLGVTKMHDAHNAKKALLIISDGGDNRSRYTDAEIKAIVKEADVQIYAIGIYNSSFPTPEEVAGPALLTNITEVTGGRTFTIDNPNDLTDVATKIGIELRNQYVLGYRSTNSIRDGRWRKVKVRLLPPKGLPQLTVYSKTGYYAPSQ